MNKENKEIIDEFRGEYFWLSNFYKSNFIINNKEYPTVEHFFQASKARNEQDHESIRLAASPDIAKSKGRHINLRTDWEYIKDDIMYQGVYAKFSQNQDLKEKLLFTENAKLVEGNYWNDCYWGVCNGRGFNRLGIILMRVREELKSQG